jgi:hypothetical protein
LSFNHVFLGPAHCRPPLDALPASVAERLQPILAPYLATA